MMILSRTYRALCLGAAISPLLVLSGCGLQPTAGPGAPETQALANLQGRAMGGNTPITNATVTLYSSTLSTGSIVPTSGVYVGTATSLGTATTDNNGRFSFASPSACSSPSIVYVTIASGNTGGGTNANELLGSVYGTCGTVNSSSSVNVNEASTLAMAYAFSSFTSIDGSGNVNIVAPAANSNVSSNVSSTNTATVTTASGLFHAYSNFLNLVNPVLGQALSVPVAYQTEAPVSIAAYSISSNIAAFAATNSLSADQVVALSAFPTSTFFNGQTATVLSTGLSGSQFEVSFTHANVGATTESGTATFSNLPITAIAPQAVVNSLANILQACVNSTGGTAGTTNCGKVFNDTPAIGGALPTNTFQAALNLARNPYVSSANVTSLFGLITGIGSGVYSPTLTSAPHDWTLAIAYQVPANPATGLGFPFTVALDYDDNVYVTSPENDVYVPNATATITRTSGSSCLFGYSSSGTLLPTVVAYSGTVGTLGSGTAGAGGTAGSSSWYCTAAAGTQTLSGDNTLFTQIAPDALGNIYIANLGGSSTDFNNVVKVNTGTPGSATAYAFGDTTSSPKGLAVDKENDLFMSRNGSSSTVESLYYMTANGGTMHGGSSTLLTGNGSASQIAQAPNWIAFDSTQNVWAADYHDSSFVASTTNPNVGGAVAELPVASGTYTNLWVAKAMAGGSTTSSAANSAPYGVATDSAGNGWLTTDAIGGTGVVGLTKVASGFSATIPTANTLTGATYGFTSPKWLEADGNNVMWIADTTGIIACASNPASTGSCTMISQPGGFKPCLGSTSTCTYPDYGSTKGVAVDSTGSVWFTTPDATTTNTNANDLIQIIGTGTATWPLLATGKPGAMPQ